MSSHEYSKPELCVPETNCMDYECYICLETLLLPVKCRNEHRCCQGCYEEWSLQRLLKNDSDESVQCPCCMVDGYLSCDWELRRRMQDFTVCCPHVTDDGRKCRWLGRYRDYWHHFHVLEAPASRKRSAPDDRVEAEVDDDAPPVKYSTQSHTIIGSR